MNPKLYKSTIPPVTAEFIGKMKEAFPATRLGPNASVGEIQRQFGQLDVIEWATQFMRSYDPSTPTR